MTTNAEAPDADESKAADVPEGDPKSGESGKARPTPVVAIGASAGGLKEIQEFLRHFSADCGISFVVIQHLAPDRKSSIAEILQRSTTMPVEECTEAIAVQPNRVCVIPPNKLIRIEGNEYHLEDLDGRAGLRRPIDLFYRSLAHHHGPAAIAVVLSGTGDDGSLGVREIKAFGGLVLAQAPQSADHAGMPTNAIATDCVDFTLDVTEMPGKILAYLKNPAFERVIQEPGTSIKGDDFYQEVLALLRSRKKFDFRLYKDGTLQRRINRRMSLLHSETEQDYLKHLHDVPSEIDLLFRDLLIRVTSFFRDPESWEALASEILPKLITDRHPEGEPPPLRAWVPGCSTGEEAYTLAMLLQEAFEGAQRAPYFHLFASDVDYEALDIARAGVYPQNIEIDVSPERLSHFFSHADQTYRINKATRDHITFAAQNIINDPPFGRLKLISCHNLLIYLKPAAQRKVIGLFHYALDPGGYLFLGNAENIAGHEDLFELASKKWRIFRRVGATRHDRVEFPMPHGRPPHRASHAGIDLSDTKVTRIAQQIVLERYTTACALVNRKYRIQYLFGPTEDYLRQPTGQLSSDLLAWTREGLRTKLRAALHECTQTGHRTTSTSARITRSEGTVRVRCVVEPLFAPQAMEGYLLVSFRDEPEQPAPARDPGGETDAQTDAIVSQLEDELRLTKEDLRRSVAQLESSNEEFHATNEEVMSINEELQSTNEELETSKEELQSLNEELTTVNAQLEEKVRELEDTTNDLDNLINSTDIATLFLDTEFRIKRYTAAASELFHILPSDVGRALSDIKMKMADENLFEDCAAVLKKRAIRQLEIQSDAGRWYIRRVVPYRTENNRIAGIVLTFTDTTEIKEAEREQAQLAAIVQHSQDAIMSLGLDCKIRSWNQGARRLYGYRSDEVIGRSIELLLPAENEGELRDLCVLVGKGEIISSYESLHRVKGGGELPMSLTLSPVFRNGRITEIAVVGRDVSVRLEAQRKLQELNETLKTRVEEGTKQRLQLRALAAQLADSEQQERRRLASDLHDYLAQLLVLCTMRIAKLVEHAGMPDEARKMLSELGESTQEALQYTRTLVSELSPTLLYEAGLGPALESLAERMRAYDIGVKVTLENPPQLAPEAAAFVYQSVRELLINASKYSGVDEVRVAVRWDNGNLHITVADEGGGFDPASITDPDDSGKSRFGLFNIRERLDAYGGRLTIDSAPGKGCRVSMIMPIEESPKEQQVNVKKRRKKKAQTQPQAQEGHIRLMLVDDHPAIRKSLRSYFNEVKEFDVVAEAASVAEAIAKAGEAAPHVVLMDINLQDGTGMDATRAIMRDYPHIKVIGLSIHEDPAVDRSMLEAGAKDCLSKVAPFETILETIRRVAHSTD